MFITNRKKFFIYIIFIFLGFFLSKLNAFEKVENLNSPESAAEGPDGNIYVSEIGVQDTDGDGKISKIDKNGKVTVVAKGLFDPKGIVFYQGHLYVTDRNVILKVSLDGSWKVFAGTTKFPKKPVFLNDIDVSTKGDFYISDTGDFKGSGQIFLMKPTGEISLLFDKSKPFIDAPNGVLSIDDSNLLIVDWGGNLLKANLKSNEIKKIATGFKGGDGLVKINDVIYISSWINGKVYKLKDGETSIIAQNFQAAADIGLSSNKKTLIVPDMKAGTLSLIKIQ